MKKDRMGVWLIVLGLIGLFPQVVFSGGIDNKQNFSAQWVATGNRNAAVDGVDIAAYNPAGIMQQENGFAIEMDGQYIMKGYEHRYNNASTSTPSGPVSREQDEPSLVPSLFTTYKADRWGLFGTVTINGGGGDVIYENGNTITNNVAVGLLGATTESIEAESYYTTYTLGASYKITEIFSVAFGGRFVDASKSIDAYAVTTAGTVIAGYDEDAEGWGWVASLNVKPREDFLLAFRYESLVALEFTTRFKGKTNALGTAVLTDPSMGKQDNGKSDRDLPAVLGIGASWDATERLNVSSSFTYYFEEDADWDDQENKIDNSYDIGISATYRILDNLRASLGYMYTNVGIVAGNFDLIAKMSPVLDAHSVFCGVGYDFGPHVTANVGFMLNMYNDDVGTGDTGNVTYEKENATVAMGLALKF